jgi:hypothetical protein
MRENEAQLAAGTAPEAQENISSAPAVAPEPVAVAPAPVAAPAPVVHEASAPMALTPPPAEPRLDVFTPAAPLARPSAPIQPVMKAAAAPEPIREPTEEERRAQDVTSFVKLTPQQKQASMVSINDEAESSLVAKPAEPQHLKQVITKRDHLPAQTQVPANKPVMSIGHVEPIKEKVSQAKAEEPVKVEERAKVEEMPHERKVEEHHGIEEHTEDEDSTR